MNRALSRAIIGAGACLGLGLALQPLYAEPSFRALLRSIAEASVLIGMAAGSVLVVGYVNHRLLDWRAERPVLPTPAQQFATTANLPPALAGQAYRTQADERATQPDENVRLWELAIIRFCIIGEGRRSFSARDMLGNVDRPTWDLMTRHLSELHVLRIGSGTRPTWFWPPWNAVRVRVALHRGEIAPPNPLGDVPVVVWDDYRHAMHTRTHATTR